MNRRRRLGTVLSVAAAAGLLGTAGWFWQDSLVPGTHSVMTMGQADHGGGPVGAAGHHHHGTAGGSVHPSGTPIDVSALQTDPTLDADVEVSLTARQEQVRLASGQELAGYTVNGQTPGPVIRATEGDLVEVRLVNESVAAGTSLHWHGIDVPNAEDGVAGVTQDAVGVGEEHTYRFVADKAGTFWYHSHQRSEEQVRGGLLGALVVAPREGPAADVDVAALIHQYGGTRTINGQDHDLTVVAEPGERARVRVINTDNGNLSAWVGGAAYELAAVDGREITAPTPVTDAAVLVAAGARVDLEVVMPADGSPVRVELGQLAVVLGDETVEAPRSPQPRRMLDVLTYGSPAELAVDWSAPDRLFEYDIGRRPGFLDGRPGVWWTINGKMGADVPMFVVAEGDVVVVRIANNSGGVHPMHLHGHHALVLSRNGEPATGSPWWIDSLDIGKGDSYELGFIADNPGIWMYHCHNLPHASEGLVTHLAYDGVSTSFLVGGDAGNDPE